MTTVRFATLVLATLTVAGCHRVPRPQPPAPRPDPYTAAVAGDDVAALEAAPRPGDGAGASRWWLWGLVQDVLGRPERAAAAYSRAIAVARGADDSLFAHAAALGLRALGDRVPDWEPHLAPLLEAARRAPDAMAPAVRHLLETLQAAQWADDRVDEIHGALSAAGCIATWWYLPAAWPPWTHFDADTVPLDPDRLYPLGPKRGSAAWRVLHPDDCAVGDPDPLAGRDNGTLRAVTAVALPRATDVWIQLDTAGAARVYVDGVRVIDRDPRGRWPAQVIARTAHLAAGPHRIAVVVADPHFRPEFRLALLAADGTPVRVLDDPFSVRAAAPAGETAPASRSTAPPQSLAARLAALAVATAQRDVQTADALLPTLPDGLVPHLLALRWQEQSPALPPDVAADRVTAARAALYPRCPPCWEAALAAARIAASMDRYQEALDVLNTAAEQAPQEPSLHAAAMAQCIDTGWPDCAEQHLAALPALLGPTHCAALRATYRHALWRQFYDTAEKTAVQLARCPGGTEALAAERERRHHLDQAAALRDALARRWRNDPAAAAAAAGAHLRAGEAATAARNWRAAIDRFPHNHELRIHAADALAPADPSVAVDLLTAGLAFGWTPALVEALAAFDRDPLAPYRADGDAVVASYLAGPQVDAPLVGILDRAVLVVHRDGTASTIVHSIQQPRTTDEVARLGQISLPQGAHLLTARLFHQDGGTAWATPLEGTGVLAFPGLEPDDIVELEWWTPPDLTNDSPLAYDSGWFLFRHNTAHLVRSELTVYHPRGAAPQVVRRAGAPRPVVTTMADVDVVRLVARDVPPFPLPEDAPSAAAVLPAARIHAPLSEPAVCLYAAQFAGDTAAPSAAMDDLVRSLAPAGAPPERTAARLYHWVQQHIAHDEADFDQPVAWMFARRQGHRARLFAALATAAGIDAHLAALTHWGDDGTRIEDRPPASLTVAVRLPWGTAYLDDDVPFLYLPPHLRNRSAIDLVDCAAYRTPTGPEDTQEIRLALTVRPGGDAAFRATWMATGAAATALRAALRDTPPAERERTLRRFLPQTGYLDQRIDAVTIADATTPDAPVRVEFSGVALVAAPQDAATWEVRLPVFVHPLQWTDGAPSRGVPLLFVHGETTTIHTTVTVPPTWRVQNAPPGGTRTFDELAAVQRAVTASGSTITVIDTVHAGIGPIPPADYPQFLSFSAAAQRLLETPITCAED